MGCLAYRPDRRDLDERGLPASGREPGQGVGISKVGLLTSFYPEMLGGAEASLGVLLDTFRERLLPHVLFTLGRYERGLEADAVSIRYLNRLPRKAKIAGLPMLDRVLASRLAPLLEQHEVAVLHVLDTYSLIGGVHGAIKLNVPTILTCQNNIGTPFEAFGARFPITTWLEWRERQVISAIKECSLIVAVSGFIARQLVDAGVPPERIETVYVPGIMTQFGTAERRDHSGPLRLLALGRLQYQKGFQVLLRALGELNVDGRQFEAKIAGRGPYLPTLQRITKEHDLEPKVQFVGQVPRKGIPSLLDWSDVVVLPTITPEPFPRAGVEAMSRGKPLIGTKVGGIPELISDGETGFLVRPGEPQEIAEKLRLLADKPTLAERQGQAALLRCHERYDANLIVDQLDRIYHRAAEMGRRA